MDGDGPSTTLLTVEAPAWRAVLGDPERLCRRALGATLRWAAVDRWPCPVRIDVLLVDDDASRALNRDHRGQDAPTDVLSFPTLSRRPDDPAPPAPPAGWLPLGDVVLALETVVAEARAEGKTLADHVGHLLVHGCLHLLGHDHALDGDALRMEALERMILADLGIADPYRPAGRAPPAAPAGGPEATPAAAREAAR